MREMVVESDGAIRFLSHTMTYEMKGTLVSRTLKERTTKGTLCKGGYLRVKHGGVSLLVHRLVAETFIPNPDNKPQVNHINGDKTDNRVENLEWVTPSENQLHASRALGKFRGEAQWLSKLTERDVLEIHILLKAGKLKHKEIAHIYGVTRSQVTAINNGRTWAWLTGRSRPCE